MQNRMNTLTTAERASQAGAQRYDFPTVKLSYVREQPIETEVIVTSSHEVYKVLVPLFEHCLEHHEEFHAILLNRKNSVLGSFMLGSGGISSTVADPRLLLQAVILSNCSSVVLAHNHPSGTTKPSQADIQYTKKVKSILELLDVNLLDHVIMVHDGYYSFANEGIL